MQRSVGWLTAIGCERPTSPEMAHGSFVNLCLRCDVLSNEHPLAVFRVGIWLGVDLKVRLS